MTQQVLIYGRVSSHDQKEDLARQLDRLRTFCASKGWVVAKEVSEIGSGLNGRRQGLLGVLSSPKWTVIVVEHRDRLSRFGVDFIEAALKSAGRHLVVVNAAEDKHDLVQDFIDVVTSMCSRIYGQRSAKNRAARAIKAAADEVSQ